jgi:L-ribulokinase
VDRQGTPLAFLPAFKGDLAAQAWLWKDHTGHAEAAAITETARKAGVPYLAKCGGTYSSEWFWSKVWHCLRESPKVFQAAYSWVEHADWMPAYVTGTLDPLTLKRGICSAGHKAMYADAWGGLPSKAFLKKLDPSLADLRDRLYAKAAPGG